MKEEGISSRILQESRDHSTALAKKMEATLETSPYLLATREFYEEDLETCMKYRLHMDIPETVERSLLPDADAGVYMVIGFDSVGNVTFQYIGTSVRMSVRTLAHTFNYENGGDERGQLYRLASSAHQVYHLPLLRVADEEASDLVLAVMEPMWSVALGTYQRDAEWMRRRREANLTNVGESVTGTNSK
jgi:hypothetical protein